MLLRETRQHAEQIKEMHRQVLLAREEERKWVARDLHDKTIQRLVGIHYHLANLRNRLDTSTATEFHTFETELRSTMEELRRICTGLRPPEIEIFGLEHSIQTRLDEIKDQVPFNVHLVMDVLEGVEISEEARTSLYRFINEGIINASRHAEANNVWIRLKVTLADRVTVAVEDDGRGFQPPPNINVFTNEGHFGLVGLKELVELAGGEMSIHSKPGEGCSISAYIPINDTADRDQ
jgi:two-component system, NarL family, sensor histidine kinase DegS